jgi:hypothetical protein
MSSLTPLGDGQFTDNNYTSPNNWGIEIGYYTDLNTGSVGFQANIPNPPLTEGWPESWGGSEYHTVCVVGCEYVPDQPPPIGAIPEPASALLLTIPLCCILLCSRLKKALAFL